MLSREWRPVRVAVLALAVVSVVSFAIAQSPDSDGDLVEDALDNCPAVANGGQENQDGDRLGDACDPFPELDLRVRAEVAAWELSGDPARATYRLVSADGALQTQLAGVQATLTLDGAAVFGDTASSGRLVSGAGTPRALVEFVDGLVVIDLLDATAERVRLGAEDTAGVGLAFYDAIVEDFEASDGGYLAYGDWERGTPIYGPGSAFSGTRAWATSLTGNYRVPSWNELHSPPFTLPAGSTPRIAYRSWFHGGCCDWGDLEVSTDGGRSWGWLDSPYGDLSAAGWERRVIDIPWLAGYEVRFRWTLVGRVEPNPGWYVDDVALEEIPTTIEFLDPDGDPDGDGLPTRAEVERGTDPFRVDTDRDGEWDGTDNCPTIANNQQLDSDGDGTGDACEDADGDGVVDPQDNCPGLANPLQEDLDLDRIGDPCDLCPAAYDPSQADTVHPGGPGDACEDPDEDGAPDVYDNCRDTFNPGQEDTDWDGTGDACDQYAIPLTAEAQGTALALAGGAAPITVRLVDDAYNLLPNETGVRITLVLSGSAVFAGTAHQGSILSGGGTNRALVEFVDGIVVIDVLDAVAEQVTLSSLDTEGFGIRFTGTVREEFERRSGFLADPADPLAWGLGEPAGGPGRAASGRRAWTSSFVARPSTTMEESWLLSPGYRLEASGSRLEFASWVDYNTHYLASVWISTDSGSTWRLYGSPPSSGPDYDRISWRLDQWVGQEVRIGFRIRREPWYAQAGWFLDDIVLRGVRPSYTFLVPDADPDADGLTNAAEFERDTDPSVADTDGDRVADGADLCPLAFDAAQGDQDRDGTGDACDDSDGDGFDDARDNCPLVANPGQADADADMRGDLCDNCLGQPNGDQQDQDGDGIGDECEDTDADGLFDRLDNCPVHTNPGQADADADGAGDACDNCGALWNERQIDVDADGTGDECQPETAGTPGFPHAPNEFPFAAKKAVVDKGRGLAWIADREGRRVIAVDLDTGLAQRVFSFSGRPDELALSSDTRRLWIALTTHGTDGYYGNRVSQFAAIDLERQVRDRQFAVAEGSYGLAAGPDVLVSILARSGSPISIRLDPVTGVALSTGAHGEVLVPHSGGRRFYGVSWGDPCRYDAGEKGGLDGPSCRWDVGDVWRVFIEPDGRWMLVNSGYRLALADAKGEDLIPTGPPIVAPFELAAFDVPRQTLVVSRGRDLQYVNAESSLPFAAASLAATPVALAFHREQAIGVTTAGSRTVIERLPHPALDGGANTPPTARLSVSPGAGGTMLTTFVLDAAASTDAESGAAALEYRWDVEGDGTWDGAFSPEPVTEHRYAAAGSYFARVQVRDPLGMANDVEARVDVAFVADPSGPPNDEPRYRYLFSTVEAVFDAARNRAYLGDTSRNRIHAIDLSTGFVAWTVPTEEKPIALDLSPDGERLLVSLAPRGYLPYEWVEGRTGRVSVVDPNRATVIRAVTLPFVADDLFENADGRIVAASWRGDRVASFDPLTGAQIGYRSGVSVRQIERHPEGDRFYGRYDSFLYRFALPAGAGPSLERWTTDRGDESGASRVWVSPPGTTLLTGAGHLLRLSATVSSDMEVGADLGTSPVRAAFFDLETHTLFTNTQRELRYFDQDSGIPIGERDAGGPVHAIGRAGGQVALIEFGEQRTELRLLPHPVPDGATNLAPEASFELSPASGATTETTLTLDASSTRDAEQGMEGLSFRWDFDSDGHWDTDWSSSPIATYRYEAPGRKRATLQVHDRLGAVGSAPRELEVTFEPSSGEPGPDHVPYFFDFRPDDAAFARTRPAAYLVDGSGRALHVVDTTTGRIARTIRFGGVPTRVSLSPDDSRLTVLVDVQDPLVSASYPVVLHSQLAVFEPTTMTKIAHHDLPFAARAQATGRSWTVVGEAGSMVHVIDLATGHERSAATVAVWGASWIALHPSERAVYVESAGYTASLALSDAGWVEPTETPFFVTGMNPRISEDGRSLFSLGAPAFAIGDDPARDIVLLRECWSCEAGSEYYSSFDPDSSRATLFTTEGTRLVYRNIETFLWIGSQDLPVTVGQPAFLGAAVSNVLVLTRAYSGPGAQLIVLDHPTLGGGSNTAPSARLDVAPATSGTTRTVFQLDASASTDAEEPASGLQFRWDADGDGTWDGPFSSQAGVSRRYPFAGAHVPRVQVRDSFGKVAVAAATIDVRFESDPGGPFDPHTPYELPIEPAAFAFDEARSVLWLADKPGMRLLAMNLETGLVERQYALGLHPAFLALTTDRSRLVLATVQAIDPYGVSPQPWPVHLMSIDLATRTLDRQIAIEGSVAALAALDSERTAVVGDREGLPRLRIFGASGETLGEVGTPTPWGFAASPSGRVVYLAAASSRLLRYEVSDAGALTLTRAVEAIDLGGAPHVTPAGDALLFRLGSSDFALDPDPARDLFPLGERLMGWSALAFDRPRSTLLALGLGRTLDAYDLASRLPISSRPIPSDGYLWDPRAIGMAGSRVALVETTGYGPSAQMRVRFLDHPVPDGGENTEPVAALAVTPALSGTTRTVFTFDATASQDAEDRPEQLLFRWDLDGDGRWDGPLSSAARIESRLPLAGTRRVSVQVCDHLRRAHIASVEVSVAFEPDPGELLSPHVPFEFDGSITRALFETTRARGWLYDPDGMRLLSVDLASGLGERAYPLGAPIDVWKFVQRGSRLLLTTVRPDGPGKANQGVAPSHIVLIDLASGLLDRQFAVPEVLADADLMADGTVAVLTSGTAGAVRLLDGRTGTSLGSTPLADGDSLAAHPFRAVFYTCQSESDQLRRFDLLADGGIVETASVRDCWSDRLHILPDGARMLTGFYPYELAEDPARDLVRWPEPISYEAEATIFVDEGTRALFCRDYDRLTTYNLESLFEIRHQWIADPSGDWRVLTAGITQERLAILERRGWDAPAWVSRIRFAPHPVPDGGINARPTIAMAIDPPTGTTNTSFTLDASLLGDTETPREELRVRWDFDGDGWWDTAFGAEAVRQERFIIGGPRTVTAEVKDGLGLTARASVDLDVVFEPDPGESVPAHQPFVVPLGGRNHGAAAAFDPLRPQVFAIDRTDRTVIGVDLETGLANRRLDLDSGTRQLAVATDGSTLSVTGAEHGAENSLPFVLSTIDIATATKVSVVRLSLDPFAIAPANSQIVFVGGIADGRALIQAIDLATGQRVGETDDLPDGDLLGLAALPTGHSVYLQAEDAIVRYDLREDGTLVRAAERPWKHPNFARGLWVSPGGEYLLADPGRLYRLSAETSADLAEVGDLPKYDVENGDRISSASWDLANREFHILFGQLWSQQRRWMQVSLDTLEVLREERLPASPQAVGKHGKTLSFAIANWESSSRTTLDILQRHVNHAPRADAGPDQAVECSAAGAARVTLDGSGSTDGDSTPGTADDIASYAWSEAGETFAGTVRAERDLPLGEHRLRLAVTDTDAATDDDEVRVEVRDSAGPAIRVDSPASGQCLGPAAVPVVPQASAQDACTGTEPAVTFEPPGPLTAHGDYSLVASAVDPAGNASRVEVPFTLDLVAPQVTLLEPEPRQKFVLPLEVRFESADRDGAAGEVVHEVVLLDGCVAWDGATVGDGDGLLSDETLVLDQAVLCGIAARCGVRAWKNPELAVVATDCGGNAGRAATRLRGAYTLPDAACGVSLRLPALELTTR